MEPEELLRKIELLKNKHPEIYRHVIGIVQAVLVKVRSA
jgi:hypothetical protein